MKDLDMKDERWEKRGAVPYKLEVPSRAGRIELCKFYERGGCSRGNKCNFRHSDEQQKQIRRPNLSAKDLESIKETRQKDNEKNENVKKTENKVPKRTTESTEDLKKLLDDIDNLLGSKNLN